MVPMMTYTKIICDLVLLTLVRFYIKLVWYFSWYHTLHWHIFTTLLLDKFIAGMRDYFSGYFKHCTLVFIFFYHPVPFNFLIRFNLFLNVNFLGKGKNHIFAVHNSIFYRSPSDISKKRTGVPDKKACNYLKQRTTDGTISISVFCLFVLCLTS